MELVIVLIYFVGAFSCKNLGAAQTHATGTTNIIADIHEELDDLVKKHPNNEGYELGIETARGRLAPKIAVLRKDLKNKEDELFKRTEELFKQTLPLQLCNEFDRFLDIHQTKVTLTKSDEAELNKIPDETQRGRKRILLICKRAIMDLKTDPLIEKLNNELDLKENENLRKLEKEDRISNLCQALLYLKYDRNARVHDVHFKGSRIKKLIIFTNDVWNEGITAFFNGHKTSIEFRGIEYESNDDLPTDTNTKIST